MVFWMGLAGLQNSCGEEGEGEAEGEGEGEGEGGDRGTVGWLLF